jgi:cytosine deaminase
VSHADARATGLEGCGISIGVKADFVAVKATHVPEAVVAVLKPRTVFREGREVAKSTI